MIRYHLTPKTGNRKLGRMAVTTTSRQSCPDSCPLKKAGCYADGGPLAIHWDALTAGQRGTTDAAEHAAEIARAVADGRPIRFNQAGDLPSDGSRVDVDAARTILDAAANARAAWTYTHHRDLDAAATLNAETPATVNLSANNVGEVDALRDNGSPVVTLIPTDARVHRTPTGYRVVRCPAEYTEGLTCESCGNGRPLCARKDRTYAIGFLPHGAAKRKALAVAGRA